MITVIIIFAVIGALAILYAISSFLIKRYKNKYKIFDTQPMYLTLFTAFILTIIYFIVSGIIGIFK